MTLQECIDRYHEAAAVRPINRPTATVTPLGNATSHAYGLLAALADLDARQRSDVLALLRERLPGLPPVA